MSLIDYATLLANRDETIRRLVAEREELREMVEAFGTNPSGVTGWVDAVLKCCEYNRKQKESRHNG